MTIVIAQRFEDRILLCGDTMISDIEKGKINAVPGWLKLVTLNDTHTVGYAGNAQKCISVVRQCYKLLHEGKSKQSLYDLLKQGSEGAEDGDSCDFLFASHESGPALYAFKSGRVSNGTGPFFAGEPKAFDRVMAGLDPSIVSNANFVSSEELRLSSSFDRCFEGTVSIEAGVGGTPISLSASPRGHTYNSVVSFFSGGPIAVGPDVPREQALENQRRSETGEIEWQFRIVTHPKRGVPLVGLYLPQINVGFLYSPMQFDEAVVFREMDLDGFSNQLVRVGNRLLSERMWLFDTHRPSKPPAQLIMEGV